MCRKLYILAAIILCMATTSMADVKLSHFPVTSPLASGRWVKMGIPTSGIYEISYTQLKALGFSDPQKVAVMGSTGGRQMDLQFLKSITKTPSAGATASPVSVWHNNDRLYFYAEGPEDIRFTADADMPLGGMFRRVSRNRYSVNGYYFLTDAADPEIIKESLFSESSSVEVTRGVDYKYHEKDLHMNPTHSGSLYWGETFTTANPVISFDISLPGADTETPGFLECEVHYNSLCANSTLNLWLDDAQIQAKVPKTMPYNYECIPESRGEVPIMGEKVTLDVEFLLGNKYVAGEAYLDYWLLTWGRNIPSLTEETQCNMHLTDLSRGMYYAMTLPRPSESVRVWDITTPETPVAGHYSDGRILLRSNSSSANLVFFDSSKTQLRPNGYALVANSDLHARAAEGADFLIITTGKFRDYAEEIARAHEEYDGVRTVVATVEEIYNEFSGGLPDPMAYKWLIKMMHLNDSRKLRNVMLFGPMTSDLRGMDVQKNPSEWIIAYQNETLPRTQGATNPNDFLVMLDDYSEKALGSRTLTIGLGLLPVRNEVEAGIAVEKIRKYLATDDFAYHLNRMMWMACPGDNHMSEVSAKTSCENFEEYVNHRFIVTPVVIDDYESVAAGRAKYFSSIKNGILYSVYFGHGSPSGLSKSYDLLSPTHLRTLTNGPLCFSIFAGCSISNFDREESGIGEKAVINVRNGFIGALIATRETYNNENRSFVDAFTKAWIFEPGSGYERMNRPLTIGETYSRFKNRTSASNKFAYHLMCDPMLTVPMPTLKVVCDGAETLEGTAGKYLQISGRVLNNQDELETEFSGELVARVMAPAFERESSEKIVKSDTRFSYTVEDETLNFSTAEVKGGRFSLKILVPSSMETTDAASLALSAYDKSLRTGAIGRQSLKVAKGSSSADTDLTAPSIDRIEYLRDTRNLEIEVSDNVCLNMGCTGLNPGMDFRLDGNPYSAEHLHLAEVRDDGRCAKYVMTLPDMNSGEHTVYVRARDLAGNTASREMMFLTDGGETLPMPAIESRSPQRIVFTADASLPSGTQLVVTDGDGSAVVTIAISDIRIEWDYTDTKGTRLVPGLYGAHLSNGADFSGRLRFPVIALQ